MKATLRACLVALAATIAATALVLSGCAATHRPEHVGGYVDDAAITSKIRSEMVADKNLDAAAIKVETSSGTVVLSGFARSPLDKLTAESIAMKIRGVSQVRNEIALRP